MCERDSCTDEYTGLILKPLIQRDVRVSPRIDWGFFEGEGVGYLFLGLNLRPVSVGGQRVVWASWRWNWAMRRAEAIAVSPANSVRRRGLIICNRLVYADLSGLDEVANSIRSSYVVCDNIGEECAVIIR